MMILSLDVMKCDVHHVCNCIILSLCSMWLSVDTVLAVL